MKGKTGWQAAAREALEEAGAVGEMSEQKIGRYRYRKGGGKGEGAQFRVSIYPMAVSRLHSKWPERKQRRRRWFSPKAAARRVHEKELKVLLKGLEKNQKMFGSLAKIT